jgi:hypothetical protein
MILNDDKASAYKLALLRVHSRIADSSAGYARDNDVGYVAVPLGLVGLYWIRLFKPLLANNLPQSPTNRGYDRLGFAKEGFQNLRLEHKHVLVVLVHQLHAQNCGYVAGEHPILFG